MSEESEESEEYKKRFGEPYTLDERKMIQIMLIKGIPLRKISRILGRPDYSARNEVRKYGGRFQYDAEEAHKKCQDSHLVRKESSTWNRHSTRISTCEKKISELETQFEILLEFIKKQKR